MVRRPLRSHVSSQDQAFLVDSLRISRDWTNQLMASISPTGDRYMYCLAVQEAIDRLAGDLTGDPGVFRGGIQTASRAEADK